MINSFTGEKIPTDIGTEVLCGVAAEWLERTYSHPEERNGQALMNVLRQRCPMFYNEITGTDLDCFYTQDEDEAPVKKVIQALTRHLNLV